MSHATRSRMTSKAAYPGVGGTPCAEARRQDRRALLAHTARSVAHALGTPLNVISGRAAMIAMDAGDPGAVKKHAAIIEQQARTISELLQRLAGSASMPSSAGEPGALDELLQPVRDAAQSLATHRGVMLQVSRVEALRTCTDADAWQYAAGTLLELAVLLAGEGSPVALTLERRDSKPPQRERGRVVEGEMACLAVRCQGACARSTWLARPAEPWRTDLPADQTDAALAFAVVYEVARSHRGWATAIDQGGGDVAFEIHWPLELQPG